MKAKNFFFQLILPFRKFTRISFIFYIRDINLTKKSTLDNFPRVIISIKNYILTFVTKMAIIYNAINYVYRMFPDLFTNYSRPLLSWNPSITYYELQFSLFTFLKADEAINMIVRFPRDLSFSPDYHTFIGFLEPNSSTTRLRAPRF